jgi:hypothetical protein
MKFKKMRCVAQAKLPQGIFGDVQDNDATAVDSPLDLPVGIERLEDLFEGDPNCEDDGFYPQINMLAQHLGRVLRQKEGVDLLESRDVFGHEWGWSIELHFHSIAYALHIAENLFMSDEWQLRVFCHAGWFDRCFNQRLIEFCDKTLCLLVEEALLEYPGIDACEWV